MPMNFPDMNSLKDAARVHNFRQLNEGESDADYRYALANHVSSIDFIESEEIRNGHGWDKFTEAENKRMVLGAMLDAYNRRRYRP